VVEKVPSWIERLLLPKLSDITGEMKAINARIYALDKSIGSLRNEMMARFEAVHKEIGSLRNETSTRFESLEKRLPMMEKLAELEVRLARLEEK